MAEKQSQTSPVDRDLLDEKELLAEFPFSRQTLWRLRKDGLNFYRANSKLIYSRSEVREFLRRGTKAATV